LRAGFYCKKTFNYIKLLNKKLKEYFIANPQISAEDAIKSPLMVSGALQMSKNSVKKE